ncbi:phasin family protein [Magnetospirillum fulvum]|uniref:Phasin family protein n=1 Tax=Magnetospirillum fulvum TaxID=1082 RepID=A0A1H6GRH4_MAGFU|nr:phasin family protein [Magnetospirillum fulvum]SEH26019.1 phasin family protein [Magnetospirillum fulvum]
MSFKIDGFETFVSFGKDNADALSKSGAASVKAIEEIAKAQQAVLARSIDKADAAFKALFAVKSPVELAELQNRLARQSFEDVIVETRKLAEIATAAVSATLEPLNARFTDVQSGRKAA